MNDRRAAFFAVASVVCALLVPVAEPELRWVPAWTSAVYAVLCVLSLLDSWARSRR